MSARRIWKWVPAILIAGTVGFAYGKLPPPTEEQKAKAAETKEKAAVAASKAKEALEKAQNRAVDNYKKTKGGGAIATKTAAGAHKK